MDPFEALGNPVRRAIVRQLLSGPLHVNQIADQHSISRPAVSRHLKNLLDAGLVERKGQENMNLYSLNLEGFNSVKEFFSDFWMKSLDGIKARAMQDD